MALRTGQDGSLVVQAGRLDTFVLVNCSADIEIASPQDIYSGVL